MLAEETDYSLGNVTEQRSYLGTNSDDSTSYRVTDFSDFVLGKPQVTTETIQVVDTSGNTTTYPVSTTYAKYDPVSGLLLSTTDANGVETDYTYEPVGDGLPAGLIAGETQTSPGGKPVVILENGYYEDNNGLSGGIPGDLQYTINAAGQETYFAYDPAGNLVLDYVLKTITETNGTLVQVWDGTTTTYDQNVTGRVTATQQAVYLADNPYYSSIGMGITNEMIGGAVLRMFTTDNGNGIPEVSESPYAGFNNGSALSTSQTEYNEDGSTASTTDQYGGITSYEYDVDGHVLATFYPDNTETISVYDASGRAILTTDKFVVGQTANILATRTVYNDLGQVIASQRVSGVQITISTDPQNPLAFAVTSVSVSLGSTVLTDCLISSNPGDPALGSWSTNTTGEWATNATSPAYFSQTLTYYNAQGQTAETVSASGLRTGTIYYPDGSVEYTGVLLSSVSDSASDPWYNNLPSDSTNPTTPINPADYFSSWTQSLPNQVDQNGNLYNRVVDQDGNGTDTYTDASGRTIKVLYDDGSAIQTFYSQGDQPINWTGIGLPDDTEPTGLTIPAGGSETITIGQRKASDPIDATVDVYDASGNLVDVYEPAVTDNNPNSSTNEQTVAPHWHYVYDTAGNEIFQIDPTQEAAFTAAYQSWLSGGMSAAFTFSGGTSFGYDAMGNKISQTLPDGEMQAWQYDQFGNLVLHKVYGATSGVTNSAASQTTWDIYDTSSDNQGGMLMREYRYNIDFTPTATELSGSASDAIAAAEADTAHPYTEKTTYSYDSLGRQATIDDYNGSTLSTYTTYTYDPITGQQASVTTPQGTVNY